MSKVDWRRPLADGPVLPFAPARFVGSLAEFVEKHLLPALPSPSHALEWHEAVREYVYDTDAPLIVRAPPGFKQEDRSVAASGRQLLMSDNASPWWIHAVAFAGLAPPDAGLARIVGEVWCWMLRADKGRTGRPGSANRAGWYVAHILRAKPAGDGPPEAWESATAERRALRNLSPMNQFLVPKGKGRHTGERSDVIATVAALYAERFGVAFDGFQAEAGATANEIGVPAWSADVVMVSSKQARLAASPGSTSRPRDQYSTAWSAVLAGGLRNPRSDILSMPDDAAKRLRALVDALTVEEAVGIANALYNDCNPSRLRKAAPNDPTTQGELAWQALESAKRAPRLRGRWTEVVEQLRDKAPEGIERLANMTLHEFVVAELRIVSQVYRKRGG